MRIAIVGSGISGLVCAHGLHREHDVTVFEADDHIGGHSHTHTIELGGRRYDVDTGFIVFNEHTYPGFCELLDRLGVASDPTDMCFSVKEEKTGLEYGSRSLRSVFAQRRNLMRPSFLRMLRDVLRFHRESRELLEHPDPKVTLGDYLDGRGYSREFAERHLIPLGAAIWSATPRQMRDFPALTFVRFFANHGLLQRTGAPQWRVIRGGSRRYVDALVRDFRDDIRLGCPVRGVAREEDGVRVLSQSHGLESFDQVIFACHSDQALALLLDATPAERAVLGAIRYQRNETLLHTDASLLPRRDAARASWNYLVPERPRAGAVVTYHMNRLQNLDAPVEFCVTLNDEGSVDPRRVLRRMTYHHPVFDLAAIRAQEHHHVVSGVNRTHYCGAYWRYGFHEDGVQSGLRVLEHFRRSD